MTHPFMVSAISSIIFLEMDRHHTMCRPWHKHILYVPDISIVLELRTISSILRFYDILCSPKKYTAYLRYSLCKTKFQFILFYFVCLVFKTEKLQISKIISYIFSEISSSPISWKTKGHPLLSQNVRLRSCYNRITKISISQKRSIVGNLVKLYQRTRLIDHEFLKSDPVATRRRWNVDSARAASRFSPV